MEQSLFLCIAEKGIGSSDADIIDHSDKWFQSKSFTIPMCPMWFKIILSSQSYSIAKCWQSKVCVLKELDLLIGSSSDPRFLMSHITRESPDDARYLESNGLNLTT